MMLLWETIFVDTSENVMNETKVTLKVLLNIHTSFNNIGDLQTTFLLFVFWNLHFHFMNFMKN